MDRHTQILAEIKEYQRLRASNALDDDGEWNFWMECHPAFGAYWAWEQALTGTDCDLAFLMSDEQRARWYCEDAPADAPLPPSIAAPVSPQPIARKRQRKRVASPLHVATQPRPLDLPISRVSPPAVPSPPAISVPSHTATIPVLPSPPMSVTTKAKPSDPSAWWGNTEEIIKVILVIAAITIGWWYVGQLDWAAIGRTSGSGGGYPSGPAGIPAYGSDGCGSRGGPGYRLANGKCASWDDYYTIGPPREEPDIDYDAPHCWTPRDCE